MSPIALFSLVLVVAALFSFVNHRFIGLPTIIGVTLIALAMSLMLIVAGAIGLPVRDEAASLLGHLNFGRVVLDGLCGSPHKPSRKMVCRCGLSRKSLFARWMTVTAPVSPGGKPRSTCRLRYHPATVSVKIRTTCPSNFPSNASGNRRGKGMVKTNCLRGTSGRT